MKGKIATTIGLLVLLMAWSQVHAQEDTTEDSIRRDAEDALEGNGLFQGLRAMLRGGAPEEEIEEEDAKEGEIQPFVLRVQTQTLPHLRVWTMRSSSSFSPPSFLFGRQNDAFDHFFSSNPFEGLLDNRFFDAVARMRTRLHEEITRQMMANQEEAEAEESQDVAADDAAADEPRFSAVSEVVNDEPIDAPNTNVEDLEELKKLSDHGFLEADWGVNTAQLRDACMDSFLEICPASVPAVFYDDIHRFPPPGVGMVGLAPSDSDAHCWMDCASKNYDALPYDCQVASDRMMAWIRAHGSDAEYVEPPQMLFLGLALHFLFLTLLIVGLARCVVVFCRLRRRRYHLVAAPVEESKLQVVKAITIQIPKSARSASGDKSDDAPILVQGTVVSRD